MLARAGRHPDVALADLGDVDLFLHPDGQVGDLVADRGHLDGLLGRARDTLAATHWGSVERLRELGIAVDPEARYVDDGTVVTFAGVSAGIDMALHLIVRLDGEEAARTVRRYIQYDPAPPV